MEFRFPLVDKIEVFVQNLDGSFSKREAGDTLPFSKREIDHIHPTFLIEDIFSGKMIYMKVQGEDSMQIPITLWTIDAFHDNNLKRSNYFAFIMGFFSA